MTVDVAAAVDWAALALLGAAIIAAPSLYAWRAWRHGLEAAWPTLSPLAAPLGAVITVMLIGYPAAVHRGFAAVRVLIWLGYVGVFCLALMLPRRLIRRAAAWLCCVVWVALAVELLCNDGGRAGDLVAGNPNRAASLLLALGFLGGVPWVALPGLFATESRGALLGVIVGLIGGGTGKRRLLFLMVGLICVGAILAPLRPSTVWNRLGTWQEAVRLFLERPLLGWGPGCYQTLSENETEHPHADSFPLTVAAEMGLLGLVAFGWLFFAAGRLAWRVGGSESLGLLAWAVHNLVDDTLWWYPTGIVLAVTLAMVVRTYDSDNSETTATGC